MKIMPLPWKKARVTRISQLVADLQSPKHGGSLVFETGFPNSLIDLFVKNRDRLKNNPNKKKNKKKKKNNINNPSSAEISDPAILPPAPSPPSSSFVNPCFWGPAVSRIESHGCRQDSTGGGEVDEDLFVDDQVVVVVDDVEKDHVRRSGLSGVLVAILKVLIAVAVAMASKKLAAGITLSAFVLLLIEYVLGKPVICYLEPCSKTLANFRFLIRRDSESCALIKEGLDCDANDTIDEIEMEGNNTDLVVVQVEEIRDKSCEFEEETGIKMRVRDLILEEHEDGVGEIIIEDKNRRRSRSAKFKAKMMKKFVPKQFRSSKKKNNCKGRDPELGTPEVSTFNSSEAKLSICENQENGLGKEIEIDENKSSHSLFELKQCEQVVVEEEERARSSGQTLMETTSIVSEKMGLKKRRKLRSSILILLILAGLVGGRTVALALTFGWWLCLKSVGILKRQSNVPMIRGLLSKIFEE